MDKIVTEEIKNEEREIIQAINANGVRLTDLRYMLDNTKSKRNHYINCKYRCENLKNWLRVIASTGLVIIGAAAISVGIVNGHPEAGNAILCLGLLSLGVTLPIVYRRNTQHERAFIKNNDYRKLSMKEYKLRNAVQRREERDISLRQELKHIRSINNKPVVEKSENKVIGVDRCLARQK